MFASEAPGWRVRLRELALCSKRCVHVAISDSVGFARDLATFARVLEELRQS
ncbi:hypothetical protein GCM10010493_49520 [Streptomyces lavendulae subsp. grasserius]